MLNLSRPSASCTRWQLAVTASALPAVIDDPHQTSRPCVRHHSATQRGTTSVAGPSRMRSATDEEPRRHLPHPLE